MKTELFALALIAIFSFSVPAGAQNVLVPRESPVSPPVAPAPKINADPVEPASTASSSAPVSTPSQATLPNLLSSMSVSPSSTDQSPVFQTSAMYVPPAQQRGIIAMEKNYLDTMQQALTQIQLTGASLAAQAQAPNLVQAVRNSLTQQQQSMTQATAQLSAQMQKSKQRLAILQSGSLRASDLTDLYMGN